MAAYNEQNKIINNIFFEEVTFMSLEALPANSRISAVRYSRIAAA